MSRPLNTFQQSIKKLGNYSDAETRRVITLTRKELNLPTRHTTDEQDQAVYDSIKAANANLVKTVIAGTKGDEEVPEVTVAPATSGTFNLTVKSKLDEIGAVGRMYQRESVTSIFGFAKCVELVHEKCEMISGGTNFTRETFRLWRLDRTTSHMWLSVAEATNLQEFTEALPVALATLRELARVEPGDIPEMVESGKINPTLTAKEAKALHTTPPEKPEPTLARLQEKLENLEQEVARVRLEIDNWQD